MIYTRFSKPVRRIFLILALLLALAILIISLVPTMPAPHLGHADKYEHLAAYLGLGLLAMPALARLHPSQVWLGLAGYGVLIEILQGTLTETRSADPMDALANAGGAFLAVLVWGGVSRFLLRKK